MNPNFLRVSVVGVTGYAGGELAALLARHPTAEIAGLFSGPDGDSPEFSAIHRGLAGRAGPPVAPLDVTEVLAGKPDVVFLATPHEASANLAPRLLDAAPGIRVIDLSGAFRLSDASDYPGWYGFEHARPDLLAEAVYGLAEWSGAAVAEARLVANPGCYPTSVLLAVKPLLPFLDPAEAIVCDCKSGTSGAGKKGDVAFSFSELSGNVRAYGAGTHRHEPEMRQQLGLPREAAFVFVPHLIPAVRGIYSTIHVGFGAALTETRIGEIFAGAYADCPLIDVLPPGVLPDLNRVVGTPRAAIGFALLCGGRRAVVTCVLDNLLKGAASQAVQNFNRMAGFSETAGLS